MSKAMKQVAKWWGFLTFNGVSYAAASSFTPSGTWKHFGLWMGIFVALCVGASMYDVAAQDEAAD